MALAAALLCVPLAACSANESSISEPSFRTSGMTPSVIDAQSGSVVEGAGAAADGAVGLEAVEAGSAGNIAAAGRSIISTGGITIEVQNAESAVDEVREIAEALGGFVESQNVSVTGSESASLSLRVPTDRFDDAFASLSGIGTVLDENRASSDVTAQHVDLQARVEALETSIARLTDLMSGAASTGELIEAESALTQRQAELDGLKAQLGSLEDQIDEATIWVSLTTESVLPGGPSNFWEGLIAGLNSITVAGAGLLVLLGMLLPWIVIAGIIAAAIVWIVRGSRRRKRNAAAASRAAAPTTEDIGSQATAARQSDVTPGA